MKSGIKNNVGTKYKEEIKKMANLTLAPDNYNKHLIRYYASGVYKGYYYCITEYLDTSEFITLREHLAKDDQMHLEARYNILAQVVSGLRFAHENRIYHGDLHQENILINRKDLQVKIIDFGTSVFNKGFSKERDNRLMLELCEKILGSFWNKNILLYFDVKPVQLPQQVIRLILKAVNKITVLMDLWEKGPVDTIAEDIASFAVLVPFFNIRYLESRMFTNKRKLKFRHKFRETLSVRLTEVIYNINKTKDTEFNYAKCQRKFVEFIKENRYEEYIYLNYEQAKVFNSQLYGNSYGLSEEEIERQAIKAIIE